MTKPLHQVINEQTIPISSSLETLCSSVSTMECVCHDRNLGSRKVFSLLFEKIFKIFKKTYKCRVMNVQHHHRYHVLVVPAHEQILDILQVKEQFNELFFQNHLWTFRRISKLCELFLMTFHLSTSEYSLYRQKLTI
jgi:hypothetical protein